MEGVAQRWRRSDSVPEILRAPMTLGAFLFQCRVAVFYGRRYAAPRTDRFDSGQGRGYIIDPMPVLRFIEPCLPSPADHPPTGAGWLHEIKHDGYRLMARRDPVGIRLITRRGNDWTERFPLVVEAVNHLKVRSCLIDGEVVCCDERGLARFDVLRRRRNEADAFLYAFDLLELDGTDLRREPNRGRKATLASVLRRADRACG